MKETLRDQLKRQESEILFPYKDSKGIWTIGVGHNIEADPLMRDHLEELRQTGITQIQSDHLLEDDIQAHTESLIKALPWVAYLDWPRKAAMINLSFNMGTETLLTFHHFLDAMQRGAWEEAKNRLLYGQATISTDGHITPYYAEVHGRAMEIANQILNG